MAEPLKLAVWKFSSCDGCQLSLLDCEDELLALVGAVRIAHFPEASSKVLPPPYDLSLVEGSVTTEAQIEELKNIRRQSKLVVTIGACATAGGIQALRNFSDVEEFKKAVYPHPEWIESLAYSRPIADFITVDDELRGCPISKSQLLEFLSAHLNQRRPQLRKTSVCYECKLQGIGCVMVDAGIPCLGPMTQSGCQALCPKFRRGCYGCFGPRQDMNPKALASHFKSQGLEPESWRRLIQTYNAWAAENRALFEQMTAEPSKGEAHESSNDTR